MPVSFDVFAVHVAVLPFTVTAYHTSLLSVTVMAVPPGITPSELVIVPLPLQVYARVVFAASLFVPVRWNFIGAAGVGESSLVHRAGHV